MPATYKILQSADHADSFNNRDAFALDVLVGLSSMPKSISSKYFYDQRGSELFRQISLLPVGRRGASWRSSGCRGIA